MKLVIASDLHGSAYYAKELYNLLEREAPDKCVLLGDLLYHGPRNDLPRLYEPMEVARILNSIKDKLFCVRGNCDADVDSMVLQFPSSADYGIILADNHTFFATHGHLFSPENPPPLKDGDILLNGHTHIRVLQKQENYIFVNPGSISLPKDDFRGYTVYKNGVITQKNLSNEIVCELAL